MRDLSQFGEYTFLKGYFEKHSPKYKIVVDVGANSLELSNSINFILDKKWKGLLIEPCKSNYLALRDNLQAAQDVVILNVAISDFIGEGTLFIHNIEGHHSLVRETDNSEECNIYTLPSVLAENQIPENFDLLTVDAEGMDYRILKYMFEESKYRPRIIVHEKEHGKVFPELFIKNGYTLIYETRGNCIYEEVL